MLLSPCTPPIAIRSWLMRHTLMARMSNPCSAYLGEVHLRQLLGDFKMELSHLL